MNYTINKNTTNNKINTINYKTPKTYKTITIKTITIISLLLLFTLFLASCQSSTSSSEPKVVIGFMMPMSGDAASYGLSILRGAQLAVKEANVTNIELVTQDSKCDPKEAVSAINTLISVNKVQAIVGEVCSGATLAAAPLAEQNNVVMVSPSSTSPKISEAGQYLFRTVPSDELQGAYGADLVYKKGYKKLAILYSNEEYGVGFTKVLTENFIKFGGKVVANEAVERGSVDVRTQLTKIKNAKADAIYIISNSPDSAVAALKQIKEMKLQIAMFGSEGLKSPDILAGANKAAEGLWVTSVSSGNIGFLKKHRELYDQEPGPFAAQAYDAFKALSLTIKNGATTGAQIQQALASLEFDGASGHIKFDANGDVSGNYELYVVENGVFIPQ